MSAATSDVLDITVRTKVRRFPPRGKYDLATIFDILDKTPMAHISFIKDGLPALLPMTFWRVDDMIYFLGETLRSGTQEHPAVIGDELGHQRQPEAETPLRPVGAAGTGSVVRIPLAGISHLFPAGHSLRLVFATTDMAYFADRQPATLFVSPVQGATLGLPTQPVPDTSHCPICHVRNVFASCR